MRQNPSKDWGSVPEWIQLVSLVLVPLFAVLVGRARLPSWAKPWREVLIVAPAVLIPLVFVGISSLVRRISFGDLVSRLIQRALSRSPVGVLSRLIIGVGIGTIVMSWITPSSTPVEYQWLASIGVAIASWLALGYTALSLETRQLDMLVTEVYRLRDVLWRHPDPGLDWWIWQIKLAAELERRPLPESIHISGPDTHVELASCMGIARRSIFQHPPYDGQTDAVLRFSEPPTRKIGHLALTFYTGIKDSHVHANGKLAECGFQPKTGNRIRFQVCVDERLVFEETRDSREWQFHALLLPPPSANLYEVEFRTNALGQPHYNWAVWGEPRLADWLVVFEDLARLQNTIDLLAEAQASSATVRRFEVPANEEVGIDTGLALTPGQQIRLDAAGKVSIDGGHTWMGPDGTIVQGPNSGALSRGIDTYFNDPTNHGPIGSLLAWIGEDRSAATFLVGIQRRIVASQSGRLHLGVNDTKGAYGDNTDMDGQPTHFTVFVELYPVRRD